MIYNHKIVFLFLFLVFSYNSYSQDLHTDKKRAENAFRTALEHFDRRNDDLALEYINKAIRIDKHFVEAYMMKAQILKEKGEAQDAIYNFEKALSLDPDFYPEGYIVLAGVQFHNGLYGDAIKNIEIFIDKGVFRQISLADAQTFIERARFAKETKDNPVPFNPVNLGDSINSMLNEYWPSLSLDESRIVFTVMLPKDMGETGQTAGFQEDFYYSDRKEDGTWEKRKNAGGFLNTEKNEGAQSLSADGSILYFTACDRMEGFGKCDLYMSYNRNDRWSTPINLGGVINTQYSDKHPSISSDNRELYFASDRPGGKGGLDIWVSRKNQYNQWTPPENLGDSVNTPGNEQSPFIHPDNQSLYFSSEGHMNLGRGDIFVIKKQKDGSWGSPVNLGYPINTHNNEIGLIVNSSGNKAYYSSDRQEERGMDIYAFDLYKEVQPTPVSYMKGRVYNSETWRGIEAEFQLIDLETGELVMLVTSNPGEGDYLVPVPVNRNYALNVSEPGFLFYSDHFELKGHYEVSDPFIKDVPLKPIKPGEKVVLNNVFFNFDKATIRDESEVELKKTYEFLSENPSLRVKIGGHTDNIGSAEYNDDLSRRRAKAVVDYLIKKGVDPARLEYEGFGASQPIADNSTEKGRAKNRRTELEIIR
ncbi:MAG: OmpA family protein [Bacteroidota bacterium]